MRTLIFTTMVVLTIALGSHGVHASSPQTPDLLIAIDQFEQSNPCPNGRCPSR